MSYRYNNMFTKQYHTLNRGSTDEPVAVQTFLSMSQILADHQLLLLPQSRVFLSGSIVAVFKVRLQSRNTMKIILALFIGSH